VEPIDFFQPPPDPVANHCLAHLGAHSDPQLALPAAAALTIDGDMASGSAFSRVVQAAKLIVVLDGAGKLHSLHLKQANF